MRSFADTYALISHSLWTPDYAQLNLLFNRVRRKQPKTILEVGTNEGGSLVVMHYAWPEAVLISVDCDDISKTAPDKPVGFHAREHCPQAQIHYVKNFMGRVILPKLDFVFIDGNHEHPFAILDLLYALPSCNETFELAMHDIGLAQALPQYPMYGGDTLWASVESFGTDPERVGLMGCITLQNPHYYFFAGKILKKSTLWDSIDKSQSASNT